MHFIYVVREKLWTNKTYNVTLIHEQKGCSSLKGLQCVGGYAT